MGINLRQNKIVGSSAYGKYYPEVDQQKTLSLRGFAKHMTDHGSLYGRAIVEGVLMQITDCLPELVAQGVPVQLGNLGTFYPTAEVAASSVCSSSNAVSPSLLIAPLPPPPQPKLQVKSTPTKINKINLAFFMFINNSLS